MTTARTTTATAKPHRDNDVFAFLDGKTYALDGISGTFRHSAQMDGWGIVRERLDHEPDAEGRSTEAYRQVKRRLKDDWSTDLTDAIERYCAIALELGYQHREAA